MEEIMLDSIAGVAGLMLALLLLNVVILDRKWKSIPMFIKVAALPCLAIVCVTMSYYKKKKLSHYEVVRHLEHVETLTPKYVYGYNKYVVEFQERELMVSNLDGYTTDSAAVADKVEVYRKVRLPVWGLIHADYGDEFLFSLKMTPNIERGLKQAEQVELKEE